MGDSLRAGLQLRTERRLGPVDFLLHTEGRWFSPDFSEQLRQKLDGKTASVFLTDASVRSSDERLAGTRLIAADQGLWSLAGSDKAPQRGEVFLNWALAEVLQVDVGDTVIFRFERPRFLYRNVLIIRCNFGGWSNC